MTSREKFNKAWRISSKASFLYGGKKSDYFNEALKQVHEISKTHYSIKKINWIGGILNSSIEITSPTNESIIIYKSILNNYTTHRKFVFDLAKKSYSKISIEDYKTLLFLSTRKF